MSETDTPSEDEQRERAVDLMRKARVVMLTHTAADGSLVAHPMATQDVDFDGTIRFIAERSSTKVQEMTTQPRVNVSYAGNGAWLSVAGRAGIVDDPDKLAELWDTFTNSWLTGGPEDAENVLIEVAPDTAEYWAAPGTSRIISLANLVKAKVTGSRIEGENEVVDL